MEMNVGTADRVIRIILGAALLAMAFLQPFGPWSSAALTYLFAILGFIMLITGLFGMCLLYRLFGIGTRGS